MKHGGKLAGVAEALNGKGSVRIHPEGLAGLADAIHAAARGGVVAALRTAQCQRLAGDDRGVRPAGDRLVFIQHPRHDLWSRVDVGCGHIAVAAKFACHDAHPATREAFFFVVGKLLRVARYAALASAKRDIDDGALPRHPRGEGSHGVQRFVGVPAEAALAGAAGIVVLDAVAVEDLR